MAKDLEMERSAFIHLYFGLHDLLVVEGSTLKKNSKTNQSLNFNNHGANKSAMLSMTAIKLVLAQRSSRRRQKGDRKKRRNHFIFTLMQKDINTSKRGLI